MFDLRRIARPVLPAATPQLPEFRRELDRLFDGFFGADFANGLRAFPALNVWEDSERMYAEAEVPGLTLDDLEITIQGNELGIKGARKPHGGKEALYHRQERGVGEFVRYVTLPVDVDAEHVEATLKHGVLTIVMPKAEQARARKIAVRAD
jgi:HSP20 family protein